MNKNDNRASGYVRGEGGEGATGIIGRVATTRDIRVTSCTAKYHCPLYIQGHKLAKLLAHFGPPTSTRETPSRFSFACPMALLCALESHHFLSPKTASSLSFLFVFANHVPFFRVSSTPDGGKRRDDRSRVIHLFGFDPETKGFSTKFNTGVSIAGTVNIEGGARSEIGFKYAAGVRICGFGNCIRPRGLS